MKYRKAFDEKSIVLILCYLLGSATLTIIAPLIPYLMKDKDIPTYFRSLIFCSFYISGLASSMYTSKYLATKGWKHFVFPGLIGLACVHIVYSTLSYLDSTTFIIVAVLNRLVEGWTYGLLQGMSYGVGSQELCSSEFDKFARTCSASSGLGKSLSMLFGSFLFSIGGYFLPYLVMSGLFITLAGVIYFTGILDENDAHQEDTQDYEGFTIEVKSLVKEDTNHLQTSLMNLKFALSIPTVRYGWMSIIMANMALSFLDPLIALKLYDMNIFADKAGYIYWFLPASYWLFGYFGGGIIQNLAMKRTIICIGFILGTIAYVFIGHHAYLHFNLIPLIILGLALLGIALVGGNTFATIYTKGKLMEYGKLKGISEVQSGAYFGGLKGSWNFLGLFLGPLMSLQTYEILGFDWTWLLMAFLLFSFAMLFANKTDRVKVEEPQSIQLQQITITMSLLPNYAEPAI